MPNQLTLDVTDPDVSEMVANWEDGGKYTVELAITQVSNDGTTFTATVDEVMDYGEGEAAAPVAPAKAPKTSAAAPPMPMPMPPK